MKNTIYTGLAALLISGCDIGIFDSKDNIEEPITDKSISYYFPLDVGNRWVYRGEFMNHPATYTVTVKGTKKTDDKIYFEYEKMLDGSLSSRLFRVQGDTLYELADGAEKVFLARNASISKDPMDYVLVNDSAVVETPLGSFNNCLVYVNGIGAADIGGSITLAPGVGIVAFESTFIGGVYENMKLEEAVVKGKIIGG